MQQAHAQPGFEPLHRLAQRRGASPASPRGTAKAASLRDGEKGLEIV